MPIVSETKKGKDMARPEKKDKTVEFHKRVKPEFVPILDAFLTMLKENDGMVTFSPCRPETPPIQPPKQRFGISPNDFLKSIGKGALIIEDVPSDLDKTKGFAETINHRIKPETLSINITSKLHEEEKDYTEWQNDDTMIEVDRAVSWGWASGGPEDSQIPPDEGFDILQRNGKLATQLVDAKRNGRTVRYNELMTELYERIKDE